MLTNHNWLNAVALLTTTSDAEVETQVDDTPAARDNRCPQWVRRIIEQYGAMYIDDDGQVMKSQPFGG